jgi:hypothetical protein
MVAANNEDTEPRIPSGRYFKTCFTVATMTWLTVAEYLCHK